MVFDFGALPPEVNSGKIYSGPGSAPLLAAATAWDALASELQTTAAVLRLHDHRADSSWQGPSSTAAASAAAPFTTWLSSTAAQAEQTAAQAQAAAAAYEAAFAASIPPPVIAANRALLAALVATNFLGINTPAIAATEATYAEFWAQDAGAMYAYAGRRDDRDSADPVHRSAGDHQRQRAGYPGRFDGPVGRRFVRRFDHRRNLGVPDPTEHRIHAVRHPARVTQYANRNAFPARGNFDGFARVGNERHHGFREGDHHIHQYDQHLRLWAVVSDRTRRSGEELVPGIPEHPEPGYRHPRHRTAAQPQAHRRGAVAAAAQRAAERLLQRRGIRQHAGIGRPGRHHRRAVGTAELGRRDAGGPHGRRRDGSLRN